MDGFINWKKLSQQSHFQFIGVKCLPTAPNLIQKHIITNITPYCRHEKIFKTFVNSTEDFLIPSEAFFFLKRRNWTQCFYFKTVRNLYCYLICTLALLRGKILTSSCVTLWSLNNYCYNWMIFNFKKKHFEEKKKKLLRYWQMDRLVELTRFTNSEKCD